MITANKGFCDCSFRWRVTENDAHGASIGSGSDAGAYRVFHGQAALDERGYLTAALGTAAERTLSYAAGQIERKFRRM